MPTDTGTNGGTQHRLAEAERRITVLETDLKVGLKETRAEIGEVKESVEKIDRGVFRLVTRMETEEKLRDKLDDTAARTIVVPSSGPSVSTDEGNGLSRTKVVTYGGGTGAALWIILEIVKHLTKMMGGP